MYFFFFFFFFRIILFSAMFIIQTSCRKLVLSETHNENISPGLRPEQPVSCSEDCWMLMKGCWEGDPSRRPFFGDVEVTLKAIVEKYKKKASSKGTSPDKRNRGHSPRHKSSQHRSKQIPSTR